MIRFIMKGQYREVSGLESESFYTIDGDLVEVERMLRKGGSSEDTYEHHSLVGVEVCDGEEKK